VSPLERLRRGPPRATAPALVEALSRLAEVRALGVSDLDLSSIPAGHIRTLARYAAITWASVIARMPTARRRATLVAFARVFEATAQDDALDVLDLMIGTLLARVENEGDQARLRTLRDLDAAALRLRDACRVALDPRYPDVELREAMLAAAGGEERLEMAVTTVTALTRPPEDLWGRETPQVIRPLARKHGADRRAPADIAPALLSGATSAPASRGAVSDAAAPRCSTRQTRAALTGDLIR
jgi:hypothetical protein